MAKVNLKGALKTEKIGDFGGICHEGGMGSFNAFDSCNFRILPDGALEKREGFAPIMTLSGEPRAFWNGYISGEGRMFALIGSGIYTIDISGGNETLIGTVLSSTGAAEFFFYRGMLYLVDGVEVYRYENGAFETVSGYVPLYGKNWNGGYGGTVNEDINYLSDKIRIHFNISDITTTFYLGIKCCEILSFVASGKDQLDIVALDETGMRIIVDGGIVSFGDIEVCLRLAPEECRRDELLGVTRSAVYGGVDDGRIMLYGGSDRSKLFTSRFVSGKAFAESASVDPSAAEVYFPLSDVISVSYGRYPITAVCRHYDRLLIFTERETWMADFTKEGDSPYIVPINSSVGCFSENGAVLGGNSPFTVSEGGIYRWTAEDDERNECNAVCISGKINDMLDSSFFDHTVAYYHRRRDEIWFADPDSDEQDVFIYSVGGGKWFRFSGIPVDLFFSCGDNVGMLYGKYIFAFSELNTVDTGIGGSITDNIDAYYESNFTDFEHPERSKHLKRVLLDADCDNDALSISFIGDRGGKKTIEIDDSNGSDRRYSTYLDARLDIGRFRKMNFIIRTSGGGRPRIKTLTLAAYK